MTPQSELGRGWLLVTSASTGIIFSSIVLPYYSIGALVVPVTAEFGWTRAEFQMAILFSSGLGAITAPVVGMLSDRFGARRIAMPGLVGVAAGFAVAASMNGDLWVLYLAYGSMALLGAGTIPVTWTQAITESFFRQRGLALGLTLTGTGICASLMPQYATWLVSEFGWRGAYLGIGILPLCLALPIVAFGFRPRRLDVTSFDSTTAPPSHDGLTLGQATNEPKFWILIGSIFVVYMAVSGIGPNLIPATTDVGFTATDAATVQSVFGVAIVVGRVVVGYLVDRFWAPGVAAVSMCLPIVGCLVLIAPGSFASAAIAAGLIGFAAGAELDLMSFLVARYFGLRHYAKIYAIAYMALAICSGTAPFLFARLYDETASYATSFGVAAALFLLGALVVLLMGRYPLEYGIQDQKQEVEHA